MEQRQPMLHALMLAPGGDRLVERIVAPHRAEQLDIAGAEALARLFGQRRLAHRQQRDRIEAGKRPLRLGIESADRFKRVAEEIEADGTRARRIEIEDAATHGILPGIGDGAGAAIADMLQPLDQLCHAHRIAGARVLHGAGKELVRRHALQHGVDRGEHDQRRLVAPATVLGKLGERGRRAGRRSPRLAPRGRKARRPRLGSSGASPQGQRRKAHRPASPAAGRRGRYAGSACRACCSRRDARACRAPRRRAPRARRWR